MDTNVDLNSAWNHVLPYWNACSEFFNPAIHWMLNDGSLITVCGLFVLVCSAIFFFVARNQKKQFVQSRAEYTIEDFVREMDAMGYDAGVARAIYEYLQSTCRIRFAILPGDDLYTVLGITDETLRRTMPALMQAAGREPRVGRLMRQIMTVKDLVGFVATATCVVEPAWDMQTA